jgi:hypothetical protein
VESDLNVAKERIKLIENQTKSEDIFTISAQLADIGKRINENDFLLMEIRSRVVAIQRHKNGCCRGNSSTSTLASKSL